MCWKGRVESPAFLFLASADWGGRVEGCGIVIDPPTWRQGPSSRQASEPPHRGASRHCHHNRGKSKTRQKGSSAQVRPLRSRLAITSVDSRRKSLKVLVGSTGR